MLGKDEFLKSNKKVQSVVDYGKTGAISSN
jgi:hypothetical protein